MPFERTGIDLLRPLDQTAWSHRMQSDTRKQCLCAILLHAVLWRHPKIQREIPKEILMNQATTWKLNKILQTESIQTSVYYPQTGGLVR